MSSIVACVKWADLRPQVDPLHAAVVVEPRDAGFSLADLAAVEVGLRLAEAWDRDLTVLCAGADPADAGLRDLLAAGADRAVRIDLPGGCTSAEVAGALAGTLSTSDLAADVVVCGDYSADRGSGTVPAFLAHHLRAAQALGLIEVTPGDGSIGAVRRLDGGRRERLSVPIPAVLSVEGSVAELRRASLAASLAARSAEVERRPGPVAVAEAPLRLRPWRPPARVLAAPEGDHALGRVVQLTGALVDRTPPRTLELDPGAAADAILDQLRAWGYID